MKWFFDDSSIMIVGKHQTSCIYKDHPQYKEIKEALMSKEWDDDTIFMLLDPEVIKCRERLLKDDKGANQNGLKPTS